MRDPAVDLLQRLTDAHGAPSAEDAVRRIFAEELIDHLSTDRSGSVLCTLAGSTDQPRLMLASHLDEVGFAVRHITPEGFLRFVAIGGWWGHTLLAQRVRIRTRGGQTVLGVITSKPPHFLGPEERKKVLDIDDMFIDIGAESATDVEGRFGIRLGDTIVPESSFTPLGNPQLYLAKAFDNRVGVALTIQALQKLRQIGHPNTLIGVGAVQEEIGSRGARTASVLAKPDVAIVLEGPPADDGPGANRTECQGALGKGPQVRLLDPTAIMNRRLVDWVLDLAQEKRIPCQVAVRTSGGTDASVIHLHEAGVPTVVVGVPARYIHTHNSIIHLQDYLDTLELIVAIGQRLDATAAASFTSYL